MRPSDSARGIKATIGTATPICARTTSISVAYWYQKEPHAKIPDPAAVEDRIVKFMPVGGPGQDKKMK